MDAMIHFRWDIFLAYQTEILLGSNALMVAAAALAVQRFRALVRRNQKFWGSPVGAQIVAERSDPDSALLGFLEHRLSLLHDRIDQLAHAEPTAGRHTAPSGSKAASMPFEYAVRMAQHGAGVEELIRACGLNRAEARLIQRVHGPAAADQDGLSDGVTRH